MKKALMDFNGVVADIVDPGEEYVLFLGRGCSQMWVNAPDDITKDWTLEWSPSANDAIWVKRTDAYSDPGTIRRVAYGEVGEQLDMLYQDLAAGKALDAGDADKGAAKDAAAVAKDQEEGVYFVFASLFFYIYVLTRFSISS